MASGHIMSPSTPDSVTITRQCNDLQTYAQHGLSMTMILSTECEFWPCAFFTLDQTSSAPRVSCARQSSPRPERTYAELHTARSCTLGTYPGVSYGLLLEKHWSQTYMYVRYVNNASTRLRKGYEETNTKSFSLVCKHVTHNCVSNCINQIWSSGWWYM